jgi:hypothetical protein
LHFAQVSGRITCLSDFFFMINIVVGLLVGSPVGYDAKNTGG